MHSPGSCQGAAAVEEVCPPAAAAAAAAEPTRFELVAGEAGVEAGQEVSISYGSWPSDVFLLFFGFVPRDNPHDSGARGGCRGPAGAAAPACRALVGQCRAAPAARVLAWPAGRRDALSCPHLFAPTPAAVLFYDVFQLASFTQRLGAGLAPAAAAAEEVEEEEWEAVQAAVQALEGRLGAPADAFVR